MSDDEETSSQEDLMEKAHEAATAKFESIAAEAAMMPTLCRRVLLLPTGEDTFCLALGSAGITHKMSLSGPVAGDVPEPAAAVAFCALLTWEEIQSLKRQILLQEEVSGVGEEEDSGDGDAS